jgi:hypothetical protein
VTGKNSPGADLGGPGPDVILAANLDVGGERGGKTKQQEEGRLRDEEGRLQGQRRATAETPATLPHLSFLPYSHRAVVVAGIKVHKVE